MTLERFWRIVATAGCFTLFGLGGLFILCMAFPLLRLLVHPAAKRERHARALIRHAFRFFTNVMTTTGVISYEVRHVERLKRQHLLVVANHPSLIDVVLLIAQLDQPDCVIKPEILSNPFMLGPVRMCGFISSENGVQVIEDCVASVKKGNNLIIFPEGTRTRNEQLTRCETNRLQRGAANAAVRGALPLTPVTITVSEPMLTKQGRWYQAPQKRPHFILTVGEDIIPSEKTGEPALAARTLTRQLATFFSREIKLQCLTN